MLTAHPLLCSAGVSRSQGVPHLGGGFDNWSENLMNPKLSLTLFHHNKHFEPTSLKILKVQYFQMTKEAISVNKKKSAPFSAFSSEPFQKWIFIFSRGGGYAERIICACFAHIAHIYFFLGQKAHILHIFAHI